MTRHQFRRNDSLIDALTPYFLRRNENNAVVAKYTTNAGQSISDTTTTILDYEDEVYDSHGLVTTGAAWKFTAAVDGYYVVAATIMFASSTGWGAAEYGLIMAYKNGGAASYLQMKDYLVSGGDGLLMHLHGTTIIQLDATEYLDVRVNQTSGGALAIYSGGSAQYYNHVDIWKI